MVCDNPFKSFVDYLQHGAKYIYEIDDDNIPDKEFDSIFSVTESPIEAVVLKTDQYFYNPFIHFGQSTAWPRGFPFEALPDYFSREYRVCRTLPPAIQQVFFFFK